jgi:hypothetical protein
VGALLPGSREGDFVEVSFPETKQSKRVIVPTAARKPTVNLNILPETGPVPEAMFPTIPTMDVVMDDIV